MADPIEPAATKTAEGYGRALPWIAALVPFLILVTRFWSDGAGMDMSDWSHYLLHARSLLEGRAYSDTGYIFIPTHPLLGPQSQLPGLPLLLAATMWLSGGYNETVIRIVMLLTSLPFFVLAGRYFARRDGLAVGVGIVFALGLMPSLVHWSLQVQTDLGFAVLLWLLVSLLDDAGEFTWRRVALVFFVGLAAMSYRRIGIAVIPGVLLFAVLNRRAQGLRSAFPAVLWLAWGVALAVILGLWREVDNLLAVEAAGLFGRAADNLQYYVMALVDVPDQWLSPLPRVLEYVALGVLGTFFIVGFGRWVAGYWRSGLAAVLLCYLALLLRVQANSGRYLLPFYPLFAYWTISGALVLGRRLATRFDPRLAYGPLVAFAGGLVLTTLVGVKQQPPRIDLVDIPEVRQVFDFISRENAIDSVRVIFYKPRLMAWYTGASAMGQFVARPDRLVQMIRRRQITHVVEGSLGREPDRAASVSRLMLVARCFYQPQLENRFFTVYRRGLNCPDLRRPER